MDHKFLIFMFCELRVMLVPWDRFKPPAKYFTDCSGAVLLLWGFFFLVFAVTLCASVWYLIVFIPDFCCLSYFHKNHSCQTALIKLIDQWMPCIDKGDVVGTPF